jgi:hypothetical protein
MEQFSKSQEFLHKARAIASKRGYDPNKLELANDNNHKLTYYSPKGIKHFGKLGYGDYIWYSKIDPELAEKKRRTFRLSHSVISKHFHLDKYSPNELAINILW